MAYYWIANIKKSKKKFENTLRQVKTEILHTTTKEVPREFIAIQAYLKKQERSQRSNLISHLIGTRKRRINEVQS